ncbi:MFS transporter [Saccharothrix syringae]|uniref:MFS transporter n=1 Tax=Saccharothrix syringae TaxID=103733 RepID=A0A5Q0H7J9_SACSY|nr:MFS transporter [Saccharothrix syringae]QFZ21875.1 MFS transporter [Saccharothrix syringae]
MTRYLVSAGLARLADEMVGVAVLLLVLSRAGSGLFAGVVVAAYTVPSVLSGPLLGAWLDRARRPVLLLAANQFALAVSAVAMLFAPNALLPALAVVAGATLPMTSGGFTSVVPRLARARGTPLDRATARDALLFNGAAIGGPALASALAVGWSPVVAMASIGALSLVGGLCTTTLRVPPHPPDAHPSLWSAVRRGLRHLAATPPLRGATVASVLAHGATGLLFIALPFRLVELGAGDDRTGLVWAVLEVGCVVGILATRRRLARWRPERVVFATTALHGGTLLLWPFAGHFGVLLGVALVSGVAQGPTLTAVITSRQRYTPGPLLGQVSTTGASLKIGAFALGSAVGGALVEVWRWPAGAVIPLVAACQLLAASLGAIAARTRQPAPVTP